MIGSIDLTSVILGVLTLLGGCGWVIDKKKHRQEVESMKADIRQKELDLGTDFVKKDLRDAIEGIYDCPYRGECPVRDRMQHPAKGGDA